MTAEKLIEIDRLIAQELEEYKQLSSLCDEKKQVLIKSNMDALQEVDNKIRERALRINNFETERKNVTQNLGLENATMSDYIKLAQQNSLEIEKKLIDKQKQLMEMNQIIYGKEITNKELITHGLATVSKLIKIIVNGATKTSQYNNYGKNTNDEEIKISSIVEEV